MTYDEMIQGIWGISMPEPKTESECRDELRGAAGDAEQTIDDLPCEEHKDMVRQGADLFRKVADQIEEVQKGRAG